MFVNRSKYPVDYKFIKPLPETSAKRLFACGFKEKDVLLLEGPYCPLTGACAGITRDYINRVFYKTFFITKGLIDKLNDMELRIVVDHELSEIDEAFQQFNKCLLDSGLTTLEKEQERHIPELEKLVKVYGSSLVESTLKKTQCASFGIPIIPRYILLYWIAEYLIDHFEGLRDLSIPMTESMLTEQQIANHKQFLDLVWKEYGANTPPRFLEIYSCVVKLLYSDER